MYIYIYIHTYTHELIHGAKARYRLGAHPWAVQFELRDGEAADLRLGVLHIYIYIYIYIDRERDIIKKKHKHQITTANNVQKETQTYNKQQTQRIQSEAGTRDRPARLVPRDRAAVGPGYYIILLFSD